MDGKTNAINPHKGALLSHERNEILSCATTGMSLEDIMLSKRCQAQ
jgi:hypothetical protein